jgi:hypothetical protein
LTEEEEDTLVRRQLEQEVERGRKGKGKMTISMGMKVWSFFKVVFWATIPETWQGSFRLSLSQYSRLRARALLQQGLAMGCN